MKSVFVTYFTAVLLIGAFGAPLVTYATTFNFPLYGGYSDSQQLTDLAGQRHYAELTGFPHNYYFTVASTTELRVAVAIPDLSEVSSRLGAILVKQQGQGGVEEIARLKPEMATWDMYTDAITNDRYRLGPTFVGTLTPGNYLLEVHSPDNFSKYLLTVGQPTFSLLDLPSEYKRVYLVKQFQGKSALAIFTSPLYYGPILLLLLGFVWRSRSYWTTRVNRLAPHNSSI